MQQTSIQREIPNIGGIDALLSDDHLGSVFLVADRNAYEVSGARAALEPIAARRRFEVFDRFHANPKLEHVIDGVEQFRASPCDVVIAVGGGTALDVAKLIRCMGAQKSSPGTILTDPARIEVPGCPLIAVTTTAGTGAEVTHFAVVYSDGVKHSVAHELIRPNVAVIDWRLTRSLPPRVTAETGLDALSQAVESLWSTGSTPESIRCASEAIELIDRHLQVAVQAPTDAARAAMCRAAHLSGKAIDVSKTTAPHALSYTMTHDYGIAHGHAVALTLGPFLAFNRNVSDDDVVDPRGAQHVRDMIDLAVSKFRCRNVPAAAARIADLMRSVGCETRLSELGVSTDADRRRIAVGANLDRMRNNPRAISQDQISEMLDSIR